MVDNLEKELKRLRDERQKKFTEEDWEGALEIHDQILELSPSALRYANRGSILYRLGRLEEAVESYRTALEMEPTLKRARADLERLEAQLPKPIEKEQIQEPQAIYSQEPEPVYTEPQAIYSQESESMYTEPQAIYSQEPESMYTEPQAIYSQEPESMYTEPQAIYSQESESMYTEPQAIYSQEPQPNYEDIQKEIAECKDRRQVAMAKEDWNAALQYHLRIVELEPTAQRYSTLGSLFYRVGRMEEAIESYQNAVAMDPTLEKVQHDLQKLLKKYNKKYGVQAPEQPAPVVSAYQAPVAPAPVAPAYQAPVAPAPVAPAPEKNLNAIKAQVEELRKQRQAYIDAEDWETVLEIHDQILALDPNGLRYSNRGAFLYRLGRYQEALEAYRTALSLDPNLSGIQEQIQNLEDLLAEEESFANDKSTQYTSSEDIANKIEELRIQRQQYLDAKEWEKALELHDQIIALEPTALRYVNRGSILYRMQRLEEAIECYKQALQLDPNMGRAQVDLERMQAELQEYQFGIPEPKANNQHENLAEKLEQLRLKRQRLVQEDKWEEALSVHDQILALEPTAARYVTKGSMLYAIGRIDESILNYRKALELDPTFERAQSDLQKLAESEMDRLRVQRQEAMAEENWERALELHDVILALDPSALRYANRGSILYRMNRLQEAKEAYQKALSLDPTLEKARTDLEELEEELAMNPSISEKKNW